MTRFFQHNIVYPHGAKALKENVEALCLDILDPALEKVEKFYTPSQAPGRKK